MVEHDFGWIRSWSELSDVQSERFTAYVALGPGAVVEIASIYTVPVKVPVATREDADDDSDEAVEFRMIFDGMNASASRHEM